MRLLLFLLLTLGHVAVVAGSVWMMARRELRSVDELAYLTVVLGFGSLQAILHGLAMTVGITFLAGIAAIAVVDVLIGVWIAGARQRKTRGTSVALADTRAPQDAALRMPTLALPGAVLLTALLLQWYGVTSASLRVAGTDAAHYHVPAAVNYANGSHLFGFLATPHMYPLGASIWAAWLLQPLPGPVLLDLVTLPFVLLLLVSLALLIRSTIGDSGVVWSPWLVALLLTAPLFRLSLPPSADLYYAAGFVALFAQCFFIWRNNDVRSVDLLALGFCTGLLLGSKTTGAVSALLIVSLFGLLHLTGRFRGRKDGFTWRAAPSSLLLASACLILSGGVWLVRNWILFGSPLAPSGLSIASYSVFPGEAYLEGGYYYSILKDLRDVGDYSLPARFALHARRLIGPWFLPASLGLVVLLADASLDRTARPRLGTATVAKLVLLLLIALLGAAHIALLIPAPWASLEWTRGLSLRFVLPLLALYVAGMALCLFPTGALFPWHAYGPTRWAVALAVMGAVVLRYVDRTGIPGLPEAEWFPVLEARWLLLAGGIVALSGIRGRWRLICRVLAAVALCVALVILSRWIVLENDKLQQAARAVLEQEVVHATSPPNDYRCVYLKVLAAERQRPAESGRRRFFVASRFDQPLELQGPELENLVFDVRGRTELPSLLSRHGPGTGARDFLVIDSRERAGGHSVRLAYRTAAAGGLQAIGTCGRYEVYRAQPRN